MQDELEPIIEGLRGDLDDTISKSEAAKVIGVSIPTLDKWTEQRIVPVKRAASGRPRVPRDTALDLAERVDDLRQRGRERNLIIALVDQIQRHDATCQREFKKLYGPGYVRSPRGGSCRLLRPTRSGRTTDERSKVARVRGGHSAPVRKLVDEFVG